MLYISDGSWGDGEIYNPKDGRTFNCKIEMIDKNTLKVTGYKLLAVFWKYEIWKRVEK